MTSPRPAPINVNLNSSANPDIAWATGQMRARAGGDMGAGRAIDVAGGKIREAALGTERALDANLARRNVTGTGVEGILKTRLAGDVMRGIGGAAADITQDAEGRRDALLGGVVNAGSAQDSTRRSQEELQLRAAEIDAANQRSYEAAQAAREASIIDFLSGLA